MFLYTTLMGWLMQMLIHFIKNMNLKLNLDTFFCYSPKTLISVICLDANWKSSHGDHDILGDHLFVFTVVEKNLNK